MHAKVKLRGDCKIGVFSLLEQKLRFWGDVEWTKENSTIFAVQDQM